jgi:hypothetical protein
LYYYCWIATPDLWQRFFITAGLLIHVSLLFFILPSLQGWRHSGKFNTRDTCWYRISTGA